MALVNKTFSDIITFTRASTATFFNSAGVLTSAATNAPRFDYNPSTLAAQGLLIEESRTNSIRNNTMVGTVAGTPGTLPTNWALTAGSSNGITRTIVGTGTENGITYIDLQYAGTAVGASNISVVAEPNNQIAAVQNQVWTFTCFAKLVGGSFANTTFRGGFVNSYTAAGAFDANGSSASFSFPAGGPTSAALNTQRYFYTATLASATTAFVNGGIFIAYNAGAVLDFTLRIGLPQLELGAFATSVIPTTTTALTRAADVASVNTLSPWYNASAGTLYAEAQWTAPSVAVSQFAAQLAGGSTDYYAIFKDTTPANMTGRVRSGGADQAYMYTTGVISANTTYKTALAYAVNDFAACTNAGTVQTDTAGALPTSITALGLGAAPYTTAVQLNGYLRRVVFYPRRLSNAELQAITA